MKELIIKVCGMRDPDNISQVTQLGVDWMGFIFYSKSPRYFLQQPTEERISLDTGTVSKVGVFVNASLEEMLSIGNLYSLDYLQLHGTESPDICYDLQKRGFKVIKVFSVASMEDLFHMEAYEGRADYFLFDTKCSGYGGSGQKFDWTILDYYQGKTPFLLSGGIHPGSIEELIAFSHPLWRGIDLNSGFEKEPALKDKEALAGFIPQIRKIKI